MADGVILHGGYCKTYEKGKRPIGVMLEDTWILSLALPDPNAATEASASSSSSTSKKKATGLIAKWARRKRPSTSYAPALRSGCTMTAWPAKNTGIMFGGVTDEDTDEETLTSVFWNDLYVLAYCGL